MSLLFLSLHSATLWGLFILQGESMKEDAEIRKSTTDNSYWLTFIKPLDFVAMKGSSAVRISKETLLSLITDAMQEIQAEDKDWVKTQEVAK
jgi:hypothetical protein